MAKRPELKLEGNIPENFKNFELRFNDFCIQSDYRDLAKDPATESAEHYKKPQLEISALRSSMPDEALQVIRYTIEPQIPVADIKKPWIWMEKLRAHYPGTTGCTLLTDRFKFWSITQQPQESAQDWEVRVRQAGSLCTYGAKLDEMCRDKFIFGLFDDSTRTELLKTHQNPNGTDKTMHDVASEARTHESAKRANQLIAESSKNLEEHVQWTSHKYMKLKREPGTCHWCGDRRGPHAWKECPAKGKRCTKCQGNDHFARVCLESPKPKENNPSNRSDNANYTNHANKRYSGRPMPNHRNQNQKYNPRPRDQLEVHQMHSTQEDSNNYGATASLEEYHHQCYSVEMNNTTTQTSGRKYFAKLSVSASGHNMKQLNFQIDTAATCNTILEATVKSKLPDAHIKYSPYLLHPYGNGPPIRPLGQVELICERPDAYHILRLQVLPDSIMANKPALLSGTDSELLGLIKINADEIHRLASTSYTETPGGKDTEPLPSFKATLNTSPKKTLTEHQMSLDNEAIENLHSVSCDHTKAIHQGTPTGCKPPPSPSEPIQIPISRNLPPAGHLLKQDVLREYADNFGGIGCLGPEVHFKTAEDAMPILMLLHRVSIAKRGKEKAALDRYIKAGILKRVCEPTPWCSNIRIREKPNKVRICIDPSQTINKAILRPLHQMPTLNEQLHKLCNAKCFSIIDIHEAFLHVPLDEESSLMTTMHTSFGRYRWLRLPFGVSSAPEEFQMRLSTALEGLEGVINIADDILLFGEGDTYDTAEIDHDRRFVALMERLKQKNIKANKDKLKFKP